MNKNEKLIAQKIRSRYVEKKTTDIDNLRELDKKVKMPAIIFAYVFGVIGALVLGTGMCLAMKVIGSSVALGVVIGLVGILMVAVNYFIYSYILNFRKDKYSKEIIALSDKIINK